MVNRFELPARFDLSCRDSCPWVEKGVHPCGKKIDQKAQPCYDQADAIIAQIDAARPVEPVGFIDASPSLPYISMIALFTDETHFVTYGDIVDGTWVPTQQLTLNSE